MVLKRQNNHLAVDVWRIFGISKLRVEIKSKIWIVVDLLVAKEDDFASGGTFDVLGENVVDDGVDVIVDVLEETRKAVLDTQLQLLEKVRVVEGENLHVVLRLASLDPAHRLNRAIVTVTQT